MADRRMQQVEQRRRYIARVGRRSELGTGADRPDSSVRQCWQQVSAGLVVLLVGLAVTVYSFGAGSGGSLGLAMIFVIALGLTLMVRGLISLPPVRRLATEQAPLSEQQPWLLAPSAFAADGNPAEPGWLADPITPGGLRFWDGETWTESTRSR